VGEAESGLEALDLIEESAPDLVLLDIQLPDVSGFELLRMLRSRGSRVKVLLTSSRSSGSYRKQLAEADAVAFASKDGLTPELLEQTLRAV
jgi:DNA-binding NarL/FixJ family response regulator